MTCKRRQRSSGSVTFPYGNSSSRATGGSTLGIHGVLELYGVAKRYQRLLYHALTDEELERVADCMRARKLL